MIILKVTKKTRFHTLSRKHIFGKTTEGSQIEPPSLFRIKQYQERLMLEGPSSHNSSAIKFYNFRSSCSQMFFKLCVIKNFANFTGNYLCWSLILEIFIDLHTCNFIKRTLQHRCFSMKSEKFLRALILKNICERLLLKALIIWDKVFKNGPGKICGRQPLKNLK